MPSVAGDELDQDFDGVMVIMGLRNYARAKAAYDRKAGMSPEDRLTLLADPMVQRVRDTEFAFVRAAMEARGDG